jgi:hypothetical protein
MKVGIVAEGPADVAVLMNILHGALGVERKDVLPIRPELTLDETDLAERRRGGYRPPQPEEFSNWALVLEECRERTRLADFLDSPIDEDRLLVIHIDTAESEQKGYEVERPDRRGPEYVERMRARVAARLEELLGEELSARSRFAVAVEETEAWLLTLHDHGKKDTGLILNPKKHLARLLAEAPARKSGKDRSGLGKRRGDDASAKTRRSELDAASGASAAFRDAEVLSTCTLRNASLRLFVRSLTST